jgi:trk system potassium uptake protein TrkH
MRATTVLHLVGVLVRLFAGAFLAPLAVALYYGERHDAAGFVIAAVAALVIGHLMRRVAEEPEDLRRVEGMAIVAGTWLLVALLGAIPYLWVGVGAVDAVFESMSGLTTTGATIFTDFSQFGRGVFFWRSLTQWLGGLGVIALFVAILPRLAIGGRQLFFAEAPGPTDEKLTPQIRKTAAALWILYACLTAAEGIGLVLVGLPVYDAACHALTTLAAGGFSPNALSIQGYDNHAAEWVITAFMFLAGANFALQVRVIRGRPWSLGRDLEFRAYAGLVLLASLACALVLWRDGSSVIDAVRQSTFQVVSILTTTGYASVDFSLWSDQALIILFVLMFVGGCAGSAAGGPKVVRHVLIAQFTLQELKRVLHPRAVLPVKLGGRAVPDEVMRAVLVFFLFYLLVFALCAAIVVLLGADLVTGITASIATLGNIGPGFNLVGPMAHYGHLHPVSKVVLTAAMWIGRLEVLTVLAILRPEVWRTIQWRPDAGVTGRRGRPLAPSTRGR